MLLGAVAASADTQVTFQVDMTEQIGTSFTPGTDTVSAHGTFNGWGAGVNLTNDINAANPNLYTGTADDATDANGTVLIYKYVIDNSQYEGTFAGNSVNRCAYLPAGGGSLLLPAAFYGDAGPTITANVTFQIDMAEQINLNVFDTNADTVEVHGSFSGWGSEGTLTSDPTILTTNSTGIVTSNVYVGTFAITGPTNGTAEFKYVMQPAGSWESPLSKDSDGDSGNRFFAITTQTLPIVSFSDVPLAVTVTNIITFEVDMTAQIEVGAFTNGNSSSQVLLAGDFNGWNSSLSTGTFMTNNPTSDTSNIYSAVVTITDAAGAGHYFKYIMEPGTDWESIPNREVILMNTSGNLTYGPVYFNNAAPRPIDYVSVTNCMVTFTVEMTNAVGTDTTVFDNAYPSSDSIYINGLNGGNDPSWWGWGANPFPTGPAAYQMTQIPNTTLFTITLPVNYGVYENLTYKYSINGVDNEAGFNDNHQRWIRSLPNYTMPVDTFGSQGSSAQAELLAGNLSAAPAAGNQVQLSWLGRRGVHLQTATSLAASAVWTDQYLTDGTNLIVAPGGMASTNYPIGPGNLFFRLVGPQ